MTKNIKITLVVILVIATLGLFFPREKSTVERVIEKVGAIVGPEVNNDFWSFNGFRQDMRVETMNAATSTVCAVRTPPATSTLVAFYANFRKPPTVATTFVLSTSTTRFSTSSPLFKGATLANSTTTISWLATTTNATAQNMTIVPNTFIVFDMAGSPTYSGLVGKCYAEFRSFD